ncbi:MAG: DUF4412 domain-containing protein [Bryobacteraceae bacterium]
MTKLTAILVLAVAGSVAARADFSYTMTMKTAGGMAAAAGGSSDHAYIKGDKLRTDHGNTSTILDLSAQTVTHINHTQKTYTVAPIGQFAAGAGQVDVDMKIDVQETGQHQTIGGYNCHEVVMTMDVDSPQMQQMGGGKMHMTVDFWVSPDVPGYPEMRALYQRMANGPGWAALTHGAGQGMQKAMADIQKKMAGINGVPVLQVIKMSMPGNSAQAAQMAQARARLEAMKAQGGEQAKMADKILATMGGGSSGGSLMEMTIESSGFSTAGIPASEFVPPAEYRKTTD